MDTYRVILLQLESTGFVETQFDEKVKMKTP